MSARPAEEEHPGHLLHTWEAALDRLERDVSLAERILASRGADPGNDAEAGLETGLGSWEPPATAGPLPEPLVGRATLLGQRQARVRAGLERALVDTRTGIDRTRRTAFADAPAAPAYVDVSA